MGNKPNPLAPFPESGKGERNILFILVNKNLGSTWPRPYEFFQILDFNQELITNNQ